MLLLLLLLWLCGGDDVTCSGVRWHGGVVVMDDWAVGAAASVITGCARVFSRVPPLIRHYLVPGMVEAHSFFVYVFDTKGLI